MQYHKDMPVDVVLFYARAKIGVAMSVDFIEKCIKMYPEYFYDEKGDENEDK